MIVSLLEMGKQAQGGKYLVQGHQLVNNRAVWLSLNHLICLTSYPTPNPEVQGLGKREGPELHPGQDGCLEPCGPHLSPPQL